MIYSCPVPPSPQSGLTELADTIVGGATGPGLSGGQVRPVHPLYQPASKQTPGAHCLCRHLI